LEGPFLKEERELLINIANLIAGSALKDIFNSLQYQNRERLKELQMIDQTTRIISQSLPVDETISQITALLPKAYQYPKYTRARISLKAGYIKA
jgi:hypothetical protein